jgi:hypothetical protein
MHRAGGLHLVPIRKMRWNAASTTSPDAQSRFMGNHVLRTQHHGCERIAFPSIVVPGPRWWSLGPSPFSALRGKCMNRDVVVRTEVRVHGRSAVGLASGHIRDLVIDIDLVHCRGHGHVPRHYTALTSSRPTSISRPAGARGVTPKRRTRQICQATDTSTLVGISNFGVGDWVDLHDREPACGAMPFWSRVVAQWQSTDSRVVDRHCGVDCY